MHGNVFEWCTDDLRTYRDAPFTHDPTTAPWPVDHGARRATRGGSFGGVARHARSAFRGRGRPHVRSAYLGFRLVRVSAPQP